VDGVSKDITSILADWPNDQEGVAARLIIDGDGRQWLQMRLHLGLLQMALDGRPDGQRPRGCGSLLEHFGRLPAEQWARLDDSDYAELSREVTQFYHRRVGLLAVAGQCQARGEPGRAIEMFRRAVRDADHNLAIMDLLHARCPDDRRVEPHEQYRPFVLGQRTYALAHRLVLQGRRDEAVEQIKAGRSAIEGVYRNGGAAELIEYDPSVKQLRQLERRIRRTYKIDRTLAEQLADAIDQEQYERAADLRDQIARRQDGPDEPGGP